MRRTAMAAVLIAAATGVGAGAARGDGLPIPVDDGGGEGIVTGEFRYVTLPAPGGTVVTQVERAGGRAARSRFLAGRFTVPVVALDGTASGLSADGGTLALIRPRATWPQARTRLAIVDTAKVRASSFITLRGDFSFDAISPNGGLVYLIQYTSPRDPTRYAVRAYDVGRGRLLPRPIVDPHEPDEAMRGYPLTRTTSSDGRWAYTLYDGAGKEPFIHALDTGRLTARCIDLDFLAGHKGLGGARLRSDGRTLVLEQNDAPLALVDTRTFTVRKPGAAQDAAPESSGSTEDQVVPALVGATGIAVLLAAGILSFALRRRRPATS